MAKNMTGRSKTPPKGDVKPLGTPKAKTTKAKKTTAAPDVVEEPKTTPTIFIWPSTEKEVAIEPVSEVNLVEQTDAPSLETAIVNADMKKDTQTMDTVTLTKKPATAKSLTVQYGIAGRRGSIRFSKSLFAVAPEEITISVEGLAAPKVKETREERRARLKALPKKTAAEKLAALEQKAARLREKMAAAQAQPEQVPA